MGDVAKGIKSFKKGMATDSTEDLEPKNISTEDSKPKNVSEDNQDSNNNKE